MKIVSANSLGFVDVELRPGTPTAPLHEPGVSPRLRGTLAAVPDGREEDPHVRFFLARNAAHAAGDELVCLTELHDDNLTAAGARMVRTARPATNSSPPP